MILKEIMLSKRSQTKRTHTASLREEGVLREGDFNVFSSVSLLVSNKHEANLPGNSFMETGTPERPGV